VVHHLQLRLFFKVSFKHQKGSDQLDQEIIPTLPEPTKESENVKPSGAAHHKLSDLGPVVVNEDGSVSTINDW